MAQCQVLDSKSLGSAGPRLLRREIIGSWFEPVLGHVRCERRDNAAVQ